MTPDELVVAYIPFATKIARQLATKFGIDDYDDVVSECCMGLLKASRLFNPEFGVSFVTYAYVAIRHTGLLFIQKQHRYGVTKAPKGWRFKRATQRPDLEEEFGSLVDSLPERESGVPEHSPEWWDEITRGMTARVKECFLRHFRDGVIFREIGDAMGQSRGRADQLVRQGMEWIKRRHPELVDELTA